MLLSIWQCLLLVLAIYGGPYGGPSIHFLLLLSILFLTQTCAFQFSVFSFCHMDAYPARKLTDDRPFRPQGSIRRTANYGPRKIVVVKPHAKSRVNYLRLARAIV